MPVDWKRSEAATIPTFLPERPKETYGHFAHEEPIETSSRWCTPSHRYGGQTRTQRSGRSAQRYREPAACHCKRLRYNNFITSECVQACKELVFVAWGVKIEDQNYLGRFMRAASRRAERRASADAQEGSAGCVFNEPGRSFGQG